MKDGTCTGAAASGMQRKEGQEMSGRKIRWALGPLVCMEGKPAEEGSRECNQALHGGLVVPDCICSST